MYSLLVKNFFFFLYSLWIPKHSNFVFYAVSLHVFYHRFIHRDFANSFRLFDYIHCTCWVLETGPKKSLQSQQIRCLFWGFYWQPSSLNWECLHHILMISLIVVMVDGFNLPGRYVSGESVQILHHPTKQVWMSKDQLLTLHLHSKYAQNAWIKQIHSYCTSTEGWSDFFFCQFLL